MNPVDGSLPVAADEADSIVPPQPPRLSGRVLFDQQWQHLTFLHWPVSVGAVRSLMPPDVEPDVWHDGQTYVGLVPFRMGRAGPGRHFPVPYFGRFLEWNVRCYSVDEQGRHGVVFASLDATRLAAVALGLVGLAVPYRWARIDRHATGEGVGHQEIWQMRRRARGRPHSDLAIEVGDPIQPTPLEIFLTARWGLHARRAGRTWWIPTHHEPFPLHEARVLRIDDDLVAAAGLSISGDPLRAIWSPGVDARFGFPQLLPRR